MSKQRHAGDTMTFRPKQTAKEMIPARWVKDGVEKIKFYKIKDILQNQNPDSQVTNDDVFVWLIELGWNRLRGD